MVLASLAFVLLPQAPLAAGSAVGAHLMVDLARRSASTGVGGEYHNRWSALPERGFVAGKVPLGLKRKGLRIMVTGGAGFVGSHFMNQLTGSIPKDIGKLKNLSILFMYFNRLSGEIPASIGLLPNLYDIRLFSNNLTGALPPELGKHSSLWNLEVQWNSGRYRRLSVRSQR